MWRHTQMKSMPLLRQSLKSNPQYPRGQDGLNALLIANAALASAKSGRGVEIGG